LEASEMQNTSIISNLKHELSKTKERLAMLESDRRNLENESLTLNDRNVHMIRSLEKQIEALNNENNLQQAEFTRKLNSLEEINANQVVKLKTEHKIDREELIGAYESRLSMEMATYEEKIHKMERVYKEIF
jgi:septal ring factor EnvC (AmiA/AmiB activator)